MKKLEGKVVFITGASSGLGEALAHSFYKAGCRIILSARRKNELERVRDVLLQMYQVFLTLTFNFICLCSIFLTTRIASLLSFLSIFSLCKTNVYKMNLFPRHLQPIHQ